MVRPVTPDFVPTKLPTQPGVYMMKDRSGEILYVGKAVNLRARVRSYFLDGGDGRPQIPALMARVVDVEVVVVGNEKEALILERTLIGKFQPRYNVMLKDDKTWLSIRLNTKERWPRVSLVRRWRKDGARYFGPYLNGIRAREVERMLRKAFGLRNCTDSFLRAHDRRACIQFNMGNCCAPCVGERSEEEYGEQVQLVVKLLEGRSKGFAAAIEEEMREAAADLRFEDAAALRDRVTLIRKLAERQRVQRAIEEDRDVYGLHREGDVATVALLPIRAGRAQETQAFTFQDILEDDGEVVQSLMLQLYGSGLTPAPEILLPCPVPHPDALAEILSETAGRRVCVRVPQRGDGRKLVALATQNAQVRQDATSDQRLAVERGLLELKKRLHLPRLPRRIECYDISHLGVTDTVASMVVLQEGRPDKRSYRIFSIRTTDGPDDYAAMREVMDRRLARAAKGWGLPDLLLVDGGRGQLNMALAAAGEAELEVPMAGLAKPDDNELQKNPEATDKVFLPGRKNPVYLKPHSPGLHLLQRVRDEAHRFAVHHQRKRRKKRTIKTALEDIPGVGPGRRRTLLRHFGSVKALKGATVEEIAAVNGISDALAATILRALEKKGRS